MHIEVEFVSGSTAWPQWRQSHWGLKESEPSNLTPKLSKRIEDPEALPETLTDARRMPPAFKLAEQNDRNRGCGNGHVPFWLTPGEPFKGEGERCL